MSKSDETRLTDRFTIAASPRALEYTLVEEPPGRGWPQPIDAGTLADVGALGEALVAFAAKPARERKPAGEQWHERVEHCRLCPFDLARGYDDEHDCTISRDPAGSRLLTHAEYHGAAPPEWCPLREGPRTVRLRVVGGKATP